MKKVILTLMIALSSTSLMARVYGVYSITHPVSGASLRLVGEIKVFEDFLSGTQTFKLSPFGVLETKEGNFITINSGDGFFDNLDSDKITVRDLEVSDMVVDFTTSESIKIDNMDSYSGSEISILSDIVLNNKDIYGNNFYGVSSTATYAENYDVKEEDVVQYQSVLSFLESQISDLKDYALASEVASSTTALEYSKLSEEDYIFEENKIIVGYKGHYSKIKDAVDWFNEFATENMEIVLDIGLHFVSDTIEVNAINYTTSTPISLVLRGKSSTIVPTSGLEENSIFEVSTPFRIRDVAINGKDMINYGDHIDENAIVIVSSDSFLTVENALIENVNIGIYDTAGIGIKCFSLDLKNCFVGIQIEHSNIEKAFTYLDKIGFEDCEIGVYLKESNDDIFNIENCVVASSKPNSEVIRYDANYSYGDYSIIKNNIFFDYDKPLIGFDFERPDGRDANILVKNNVGISDYNTRATLNVVNSTYSISLENANQYYKLDFPTYTFSGIRTKVEDSGIHYLSDFEIDFHLFSHFNLSADTADTFIKVGIVKNGVFPPENEISVNLRDVGQVYSIFTTTLLNGLSKGDYYEVWVLSPNGNIMLQMRDMQLIGVEL